MNDSLRKTRQESDPAQTGDALQSHVGMQEMDAYHQGSLPPVATDRVKKHLVLCRECRDQFLELARFLEDDGSEGRVWSGEVAAVWQDWWATLKEQEERSRETAATEDGGQG